MLLTILSFSAILSALMWLGLLLHPDQPHNYKQDLPDVEKTPQKTPFVSVVIPARNEEEILPQTLPSIFQQSYPCMEIILVDDHSSDQTAQIAQTIGKNYPEKNFHLVKGKPLAKGWAGKMWALHQGLDQAKGEWILLTDADILYPSYMLSSLIRTTEEQNNRMISVMARLRTKSFWERLLIPAFVYFFKVLYPFRAINSPHRKTAGAAGGCILVERKALDQIGGIAAIGEELIDDVSLGKKLKKVGSISLWTSQSLLSIRPYNSLSSIWQMVSRSAFTQLKYSYTLLLICCILMVSAFLIPLGSLFLWGNEEYFRVALVGTISYSFLSLSYWPSVHYFRLPFIYVLFLPLIGILYLAMTIDSAWKYTFGVKASWKGRDYKT